MNRSDLAASMRVQFEISKADALDMIDFVFSEIVEAVGSGDKARFPEFGTFEKQVRKARTGRNPMTGKSVEIPERYGLKFKPSTVVKEAFNA